MPLEEPAAPCDPLHVMPRRGAHRGYVYSGAGLALLLVASIATLGGQSTPAPRPASPQLSSDQARALLDKYCVSCHNDRLKTQNLSLQGLDLTNVADHAEVWEKVIRKMRAGVMPPPDVPRPPLAEYDALRGR